MQVVKDTISVKELKAMTEKMFGGLVKAVIDIKKEIMIIDAPMHADLESELINNGSKQENLWGINLYPEKSGAEFIEFDSMINLKPSQNNRSRGIDDPKIREKIIKIVEKLISK